MGDHPGVKDPHVPLVNFLQHSNTPHGYKGGAGQAAATAAKIASARSRFALAWAKGELITAAPVLEVQQSPAADEPGRGRDVAWAGTRR